MLSDEEGAGLVLLARRAVGSYLSQAEPNVGGSIGQLSKAGTFVTIYSVDEKKRESLRGCVGFPMPEKRLEECVIESARAAAFDDPRFPPLQKEEFDRVIFEVSVLTPPVEIAGPPADRASKIVIGRDGLILRWKYGSGLLLPQVPVELNWTKKEYLLNICGKAGAPLDEWSKASSKLYTFQAVVFKEPHPHGKPERLHL